MYALCKDAGCCFGRLSKFFSTRKMSTLESLRFDNLALRALPIDPVKENYVRQVSSSCFSLVDPTPVNNPEIVLHSESAMNLLDLRHEQIERPEFVEFFSGNKRLPGSKTASHCYCGHQFGSFAGQLGDGAAMYVHVHTYLLVTEAWGKKGHVCVCVCVCVCVYGYQCMSMW